LKNGFVKIACCTPEIRVADCEFNKAKILEQIEMCKESGTKIIVFPELCVTGATCGDLFVREALVKDAEKALLEIAEKTARTDGVIIVGAPVRANEKLYNCAVVMNYGEIIGIVPKTVLSNSDRRVFSAFDGETLWADLGENPVSVGQGLFICENMSELKFGIEISDDAFGVDSMSESLVTAGATVMINLCAMPEVVESSSKRRDFFKVMSEKLCCTYVVCSAGDGESTTDCVFAGHNIICENGKILAESKPFENEITISEADVKKLCFERRRKGFETEDLFDDEFTFNLENTDTQLTRYISKMPFVPECEKKRAERCEDILTMQAKGLAKRFEHTNSKTLVIGISGGLDSTLALLVCAKTMDMLNRPRTDIVAVTMPCFGTTKRTRSNAEILCNELGVAFREVDISKAVLQHFEDIGHDKNDHSVTYENSQARERTQVIMDIANQVGGLVVGTGDLSELALGWATYNGDHMSMYGVNASIPKTLVRYVVRHYAESCGVENIRNVLLDIVDTPVSPELLPTDEKGEMTQKTEDLVGPYELHDFFIYYALRWGFEPEKLFRVAEYAFDGEYDKKTILFWLRTFFRRFINQQFKRSCLPDGAKIGAVSLSPRGDFSMPSDASANLWLREINEICKKENITLN